MCLSAHCWDRTSDLRLFRAALDLPSSVGMSGEPPTRGVTGALPARGALPRDLAGAVSLERYRGPTGGRGNQPQALSRPGVRRRGAGTPGRPPPATPCPLLRGGCDAPLSCGSWGVRTPGLRHAETALYQPELRTHEAAAVGDTSPPLSRPCGSAVGLLPGRLAAPSRGGGCRRVRPLGRGRLPAGLCRYSGPRTRGRLSPCWGIVSVSRPKRWPGVGAPGLSPRPAGGGAGGGALHAIHTVEFSSRPWWGPHVHARRLHGGLRTGGGIRTPASGFGDQRSTD